LVLGPALEPARAQGKPIRIGEINSYSGLATVFTFPYKEGLALATQEINDAGGVLGRPLEFIHRDDKLKPDEAVKAARELVLQEKVVDLTHGAVEEVLDRNHPGASPAVRHRREDLPEAPDRQPRHVGVGGDDGILGERPGLPRVGDRRGHRSEHVSERAEAPTPRTVAITGRHGLGAAGSAAGRKAKPSTRASACHHA
ncbi:MAG: ABC transporter substrate-binding protein, partial [Chloroflexi bacterium]|nr:ABC transporter substrate-binding protein [Chloroflexota bacterium]